MLEWVILVTSLISYYLIGLKLKIGFVIGFIGSLSGLFLFSDRLPMFVMYLAFSILNVFNYFKWQQLK